MTKASRPIIEDELHAYVDGRLSPERRAEVESYLAEDSAAAERVASYRQQNDLLQELYGPVEQEPVPQQLMRAAKRPRYRVPWRYAAVVALVFVSGAGGWMMRAALVEQPVMVYRLGSEAAVAHAVYTPEVRHPVEVSGDQEAHLVQWLSKRLGEQVRAPHLSKLGYGLVGGRLLPSDEGPAAQFMYEDASGRRLTLYVRANKQSNEKTAFRYAKRDHVSVFYWIDGPLGYALAGEIEKARLLDVANAVYQQLNPY